MLKKSFAMLLAVCALMTAAPTAKATGWGAGDILVVGELSLITTNGGRHFGTFWGGDGVTTASFDQSYEQSLVDLLSSRFPSATVDFIDINDPVPGTTGSAANRTLNNIQVTSQTAAKLTYLNAYDLIVVGNSVGSTPATGGATTTGGKNGIWNTQVTVPLVCMKAFITRGGGRWAWYNVGAGPTDNQTSNAMTLVVKDQNDPAWAGIPGVTTGGDLALFENGPYAPQTTWFTQSAPANITPYHLFGTRVNSHAQADTSTTVTLGRNLGHIKFTGSGVAGNYTGSIVISKWEGGTPFYTGGPFTPAADRILFVLNDDRNQIDPPFLSATYLAKAYDCIPYWTENTKQLFENLIIEAAPQLPVTLSDFQVD